MTDRERQLIESYIPGQRDPELDFDEYYVLDARDRPVKVRIVNIAPRGDRTVYQVETPAGRLVHGCWETDTETWGGGWYAKAHLYDNKDDCRSSTHLMYDEWERLRETQRKEQGQCTEI